MLTAYEKRYPESARSIARNALLHHADIDFSWDMSLLIRPFNWKKINARLRRSAFTPEIVFKPESQPMHLLQQMKKNNAEKEDKIHKFTSLNISTLWKKPIRTIPGRTSLIGCSGK
jgi:hypothetical protein